MAYLDNWVVNQTTGELTLWAEEEPYFFSDRHGCYHTVEVPMLVSREIYEKLKAVFGD